MNNEPTTNDILEAVNALSTQIDERFSQVDGRLSHLENDVTELKGDVMELKGDMTELKGDVGLVRTAMVTKNYLDDKLADLRGDLVVLMRKEDKKVQSLVELLHSKKVISEEEAKRILSMDLFPQVSLQ